jgi:Gram-negative bacterial TonB protein C-terminal
MLGQMKAEAVKPAYASSANDRSEMSVADQNSPATPVRRRAPVCVRLSPELVNTLSFGECLRDRRNAEDQLVCPGLLFGRMRDAIVTVRAVKTFPASLSNPLSAGGFSTVWAIARTDPELASLDLVGWCAVQQGPGLLPTGIDFHNRHFRRLSDIALLVTPEREAGFTAGLYTRSGDGVPSRDNLCCTAQRVTCALPAIAPVELTVRARIDGSSSSKICEPGVSEKGGDRGQPKRNPTVFRRPEAIGCPEPPMEQLPPPGVETQRALRWTQWRWFSAVLAIFAGICGGTLVYLIRVHPLAPGSSPPATKTELAGAALNLELAEQGSRLRLSWNRRNPAVEGAIAGVLEIGDGGRHQEIQLDAEQIREGAVSYKPNSTDLTFRLKLRGKNGENTAAILRSVDGTAPRTANGRVPANLSPEKLPHRPRLLHAPHGAAVSAKIAIPHTSVGGFHALDALAHAPAAVSRLQAAVPPSPVVPVSELTSAAQMNPKYMSELTGLSPLTAPAVRTSEMVKQPATHRNIAPFQNASGPVNVSPPYVTPLSPPRPLRQVLPPAVPAGVILYKDVQVQIQLNIDERGRVITARPSASPEKVSQSLLGAALKAATQWQFQPATLHGQPVGSEYTVIFEFHPKQY